MTDKKVKANPAGSGFVALDEMVSERTARLLKSHLAESDLSEDGDVLISGMAATRGLLSTERLGEGVRIFGRKNAGPDHTFVVMALAEMEDMLAEAREVSITAALAPRDDLPAASRLPRRRGRHSRRARYLGTAVEGV